MGATEVLPFPLAEELVPASDEAEDDGQVNALDQGEQSGLASQIRLKLMEGSESFFCFEDKLSIFFESTES